MFTASWVAGFSTAGYLVGEQEARAKAKKAEEQLGTTARNVEAMQEELQALRNQLGHKEADLLAQFAVRSTCSTRPHYIFLPLANPLYPLGRVHTGSRLHVTSPPSGAGVKDQLD